MRQPPRTQQRLSRRPKPVAIAMTFAVNGQDRFEKPDVSLSTHEAPLVFLASAPSSKLPNDIPQGGFCGNNTSRHCPVDVVFP